MEQMRLVEPHILPGHRVARHHLAALAGAQFAVILPDALDGMRPAIGLDLARVFSVEHLRPFHIKAVAVVAHVHQPLLHQPLTNARRHAPVHLAAVGNRRLATGLGGDHAVEPDLHRPFQGIGLLVVQGDALVRRVLGGGVHALGHVAARGGAKLVVEQRVAEGSGELAESFGTTHLEAAKQDAASLQQVPVHQRLQLGKGFQQVDTRLWRAHQQRQVAARGVQGFDRKAQQFTHVRSPQARAA
ncbi:hypothetical protein D3C72_1176270 [compost metagenome]